MGPQPEKSVKQETTAKKKNTSSKIIIIVAFLLIVAGIAGVVIYQKNQEAKLEAARLEDERQRLEAAYQEAISAKEAGDYGTAADLFAELGDYKDSPDKIQECYDAQSLEYLQAIYQSINTVYKMDNKLVDTVSTVIRNIDKVNSAGTLLRATPGVAMSSLYSGKEGHRAYARCSAYDLAKITAYFPSAKVSEGRYGWYEAYVLIFSAETSQKFVESIESTNTLMKDIQIAINTEDLSTTYQEIQEQLRLTYDTLKDYHSFVANKPTDLNNYETTAAQKEVAVSDLLKNLPSIVKRNK